MPYEPSLAELFDLHRDAVKDDIKKIGVGRVVGVGNLSTRGTVDVEPGITNPLFDVYGNREDEQLAILSDIPLGTWKGSGFLIYVPVQVGDTVALYASDLALDNWRGQTGPAQTVAPGFSGKHSSAGFFALPVLAPDAAFPSSPASAPTSMIMGADSGVQMRITNALASIASNFTSAQYVALSNLVDDILATICQTYNQHVHVAAGPGVITSPPTNAASAPLLLYPLAAPPGTPPSTAAAKLKAQ